MDLWQELASRSRVLSRRCDEDAARLRERVRGTGGPPGSSRGWGVASRCAGLRLQNVARYRRAAKFQNRSYKALETECERDPCVHCLLLYRDGLQKGCFFTRGIPLTSRTLGVRR